MFKFECVECGKSSVVTEFAFGLLSKGVGEHICPKCEKSLGL